MQLLGIQKLKESDMTGNLIKRHEAYETPAFQAGLAYTTRRY